MPETWTAIECSRPRLAKKYGKSPRLIEYENANFGKSKSKGWIWAKYEIDGKEFMCRHYLRRRGSWKVIRLLVNGEEYPMSNQYKFVENPCPQCEVLGDFEGHEHQYVLCQNPDHKALELFWDATPKEVIDNFGHSVGARWFIPKEGEPTIYRRSISGGTKFYCHIVPGEGKVMAAPPVEFPKRLPAVWDDDDEDDSPWEREPVYIEALDEWFDELLQKFHQLLSWNHEAVERDAHYRIRYDGELQLFTPKRIGLLEEILKYQPPQKSDASFRAVQAVVWHYAEEHSELPEIIVTILRENNNVFLRRAAAAAVEYNRSAAISQQIAFALDDPDSEVRSLILDAMNFDALPEELIPRLQQMAQEDEENVRRAAAFALRKHCPEVCLQDRSWLVRRSAQAALNITGQPQANARLNQEVK